MRYLMALLAALLLTAPAHAQAVAWQEQLADAYVRGLYANDLELLTRVFPTSEPEQDTDESKVNLDDLQVRSLTREEAQDLNPLSTLEYVEVTTRVSYGDRTGKGAYTVTLKAPDGYWGYRVVGYARTLVWDTPAAD